MSLRRSMRRVLGLALVCLVILTRPSAILAASSEPKAALLASASRAGLDVPLVVQTRERCGPAALQMVLRYYGADAVAMREADTAYDPLLHGSLITDLAAAARRCGYRAAVVTLTPDSLVGLLHQGIPPIILFQAGSGPITVGHFGVVTCWDPASDAFTLNDGGARPHFARRAELVKRWQTAGSQALVVARATP